MAWAWLRFWKPPARLKHVRVCLYTRKGCHLCEDAWSHLQQAQERWGFHLGATDVDTDPELVRLHGQWVPVVTVDDKVRFRGKINPVLLNRLLQAEPGDR
jgi:hypothetical protein